MEMRNILRKCMTDFLMIQAGITLATGVLGCFAAPPREVSPTVFFMPFVYAFFCVMPSFVIYSARELSVRQMLVRKVIQFLLIEAIVMLISYISGVMGTVFLRVAIPVSAAVIYAAVNVLDYLFCRSDAHIMTEKIQRMKEKGQNGQ